jgi:hypothetical protein
MKKGCLIFAIVAAVLIAIAMGTCGYSLYNIATEEVPKARVIAENFVQSYNADDYDAIYALYDPIATAQITKDKNVEQTKKGKEMIGNITIMDQISFQANNVNGQSYLTVSYNCDGEKGRYYLTVRLHRDSNWKLLGYNMGANLN